MENGTAAGSSIQEYVRAVERLQREAESQLDAEAAHEMTSRAFKVAQDTLNTLEIKRQETEQAKAEAAHRRAEAEATVDRSQAVVRGLFEAVMKVNSLTPEKTLLLLKMAELVQ